ncbi:hypothetical protein KL930_003240 [Ogataea haglerorum]|uniref:BHLH domain-containing protein n=1 Tax=Ogataea haglerorum TaxID=1937702 RepID=A0ABQ7RHW8_9ASCO|nr:hypothetical protein KL914_002855 [Ogataea haglerorum]KAG7739000.1 hypothetical protein KL923_002800 [Ogataea haglerorum]KAG7765952.1 hypothetical protein KL946_002132 [Ogataea haglerorum]KAG7776118.1 hypothetical protein KL930_003240 [Ogataea haglerorum]KAG7776781.1 hypothetical protein KL922_003474 [Ogataea haglerorum]
MSLEMPPSSSKSPSSGLFSPGFTNAPAQGNMNAGWDTNEATGHNSAHQPDYFSADLDFDTAYMLMTNELDAGVPPNAEFAAANKHTAGSQTTSGSSSSDQSTTFPQTPPMTNVVSTGLSPFYRSPKLVHEQLSRPLTPDNTKLHEKNSFFARSSSSFHLGESSPAQATSPVSPNTRNLLTTFNNLSYSANLVGLGRQQSSELLSVSETSALENFLDSIANDQSLSNLSKHWHSIDPLASSIKDSKKVPDAELEVVIKTDDGEQTLRSPPTQEEKLARANYQKRQRSESLSKKLLTEEEKKLNHSTSEQKRRAMIKNAFEDLCDLITSSPVYLRQTRGDGSKPKSKRKTMSKYNIMMHSIEEIDRLQDVNRRLKQLIG